MKNTIYILSLEPLESRYTGQWYTLFPDIINTYIRKNNLEDKYNIYSIDGYSVDNLKDISTETSTGAFLNFIDTNLWKNNQVNKFISLLKNGFVKSGDKVIFPDGWHTGLLQIKYMSELIDIPLEIHSIFHAGSYDPNDFLGRKIKDKKWTYNLEKSFYYASNKNYFATLYHKNLFVNTLGITNSNKYYQVGLPFDYLKAELEPYSKIKKENIVLFPHRISEEKQVEIFKDLASSFSDYEFIVCQEKKLSKHEYHTLLGRSKMIFSANLQETLGISCYEGLLVNSLPFVPERLSYEEIYPIEFTYPSIYSLNWEYYQLYKDSLINYIRYNLDNYDKIVKSDTLKQAKKQAKKFFTSDSLMEEIFK